MKNLFTLLSLAIFLSSCEIETPLDKMSKSELAALSDSDICYWAELGESNAVPEMHKRNLNCSPDYRYCSDNGFKPGTKSFLDCLKTYQKQIAKQEADKQEKILDQREREACLYSREEYQDCVQKARYYRNNPSAAPVYTPQVTPIIIYR
ncbi:MAG: hypothetical protein ACOYJ2_00875 [Rickettsiales bacterium]